VGITGIRAYEMDLTVGQIPVKVALKGFKCHKNCHTRFFHKKQFSQYLVGIHQILGRR
jgi:hypothetical protein